MIDEIKYSMKNGHPHCSTPWGDFTLKNSLDQLDFSIDQLCYYLRTGQSPHPCFTEDCIDAYKYIRSLNDETIAKRFFELRREGKNQIEAAEVIRMELKATEEK